MADYHCIWGNPIVRLSDSGKSGGGHDGRGGEMEKESFCQCSCTAGEDCSEPGRYLGYRRTYSGHFGSFL